MPSKKRKRSKNSPSPRRNMIGDHARYIPPFLPNCGPPPPQPLMAPFMPTPAPTMPPFGFIGDTPPPRQPAPMPQNVKYYDCRVCNIIGMVYSIGNMDQHFTSETHKHMKVFYDNDMWPGRKGTKERPQIYGFLDRAGTIKCGLCNSTHKNGTELLKHQHQPLHLKLLHDHQLQTKIPVLFYCEVCDVSIRGHDAYLAHNNSPEHVSAVNAKKAPEIPNVAPVKEPPALQPRQEPLIPKKAPSNNFLSLNDKFTTELLTNLVTSLKSLVDAMDKSDLLIAAMIKNEQDFSTSDAAAMIRQTLLGKIAQECKIRQQTRRSHELAILKMLLETLQLEQAKDKVQKATKELFGNVGKHQGHSPPKIKHYDVPRPKSPWRDRNLTSSHRRPRTPPPLFPKGIDDKILPNGKRFVPKVQQVITLKDSPPPPKATNVAIPGLGDDAKPVPELSDEKIVAGSSNAKKKLSIELKNDANSKQIDEAEDASKNNETPIEIIL